MSEQIYKIIYVSAASHPFSEAELLELLEKAQTKNKAKNITGILLYHQDNFFQLIEGAKEDVMQLFKQIEDDSRHTQVLLLLYESADTRDFPDWSMGYRRLNQLSDETLVDGFNQILETPRFGDNDLSNMSGKARIFLKTFKDSAANR